MEDKIEVGEYVRLERGDIFKIDEDTVNYYNSNIEFIRNEIVKHSKNIIDLIEEGDYVNGKEIKKVNKWKSSKEGCFKYLVTELHEIIRGDEIKSIVTHEQYKQIEYIVKE